MKIDPDREVLPPSDMLGVYSDDDRCELSGYGRFIVFRPDDVLIREGHEQNRLCFLVAGGLDVVHETETGPVPVGRISEGEWFGEINMFDASVASATVVARSESQVWYLSRDRLEDFLNTNPALGCQLLLGVGEVLARRIRDVLAKLNATWELSA